MIDLVTGLPGNAKTLFTIAHVKELAAKENRPVFYSGIPELTLDWQEIDPLKWMDVPPRSIVIIDECQKIFRNRSLGTQPGKHVTDLETHRHLGIDLFFITQHPALIDPAIRRLAGRHRHMVRIWGLEASTVHKWDSVKDNCDKPAARADSEKSKWAFDKSIYKLYKSADSHTMKRSIPMRVKLLLLVPVLLALAAYAVYHLTVGKHQSVPSPQAASATRPAQPVAPPSHAPQAAVVDPVVEARAYIAWNTPRVVGLPQTAPKYDELTKPVRVPIPAACVSSGTRCQCYTQQATKLAVEHDMCMAFAKDGWFQDFDADRDRKAESRQMVDTGQGAQVAPPRPDPTVAPPGAISAVAAAAPLATPEANQNRIRKLAPI